MDDQSLQILVVESNPTDVFLLKKALEDVQTVEVVLTHAKRLEEALRCLHERHFDAVLLHLNLPDSQGLETFTTMQREYPAIPILILSGRDDEEAAIQAVQDGAQDFIAKGNLKGVPVVRSIRYAMERKRSEQRLIASEAGYRRLFETAQDGIFILDADSGQITDANPCIEEMLGYTITEFIGKRLWEIAPFRDKAANQAAFRTLQEKGYIRYEDLPLMTRDGERATVEFVSNVYEVGDKRVIQCNIRDISVRTLAEAAEQTAKRFLQSTLDALSSHIAVLNESGEIIAVNQAWSKFAEENEGTPISCGVGANYLAVCDSASGAWLEEAPAVAQGIREVMAGQQEAFCIEYPCHSPSEERWFSVCVTRFRGEGPIRVAVAHENITERKRAENLVSISEANLAKSQEMAHLGSWELDLANLDDINANPLRWSDEIFRIFGYAPGEFEPSNEAFFRAVHPDDRATLSRMMAEAIQGGKPYSVDHRIIRPDGTERIIHAQSELIYNAQTGQPLKMVGLGQDITERKQAEVVLQEHAQISELSFDAVLVWKWNGPITFWNAGAESLYGISREEAIGRVSHELLNTTHPQGQAAFLRLLETEGQCEAEVLHTKADGQQIVVETRHKLIRGATGAYVIETNRDITERRHAENALHRSESLFRALVQNSWNGFQLVQPDGQITYESPASARLLGYSAEEMEGHNALEFIHPDDAHEVMEGGQSLLEAPGKTRTVVLRIRHKDGSWRWIESYEINLLDHPDVGAIAVNYHDITERKEAEEALLQAKAELELKVIERTAELNVTNEQLQAEMIERKNADAALYKNHEFLEAVLENTAEGIVACDAEGQLNFFNRATRDFHGLPLEPLPPVQWAQYYTLYMPDGITPMPMEEVPLFKALNGDLVRDMEMVIAPLDSTPRLLIANGELLFDAEGAKMGAVVVMHDITQRKQAEVELQRSGQELQDLIDAMTTLAAKVAPDGTFLIVNKIAIDASGLSREEYMETNFLEGPWWNFDPEVQTRVSEKFQQALAGTPINYEESIFIFGQKRMINFSLIPMRDGNSNVEYLIAEGRDITELKHTEKALQKAKIEADRANLAKSEFLSRMSHELRTPLNAILGFGQILEMDEMPPRRRENVQHILKGGRHLLDLINEVLDISRIEAGHIGLSLEPVLVNSSVLEVLDLVRPLTVEGNVQLINEIPPHSDWCMLGDRQRLTQTLLNLVSNAIKYNRDGGSVTIVGEEVSREAISGQGGEQRRVLRLSIRDTGNGLSKGDIARLFVPFERLGAAKTRIEGTGIGLALSKRLVEVMDGQIGVWSTPGQGSTFWIELPLVPNPLHSAIEMPEPSALQTMIAPEGEPKTVLYIEDNLANVRLIEMLLEARPNVRLLTAMQGSTGLDLAFEHSPDLILLDLHLPDINGDEVLRRLQANTVTRSTPVVMISADATLGQIERLLAAGAKTYLTKPLNVKEFLSVLKDCLKAKE